ncbi:MAG TPA: 50S ribosomal protein L34e [Candidatus Binatia bacterium]|nr:50S ribosomal protein L34e [Candidatus Binatia bacterium]
MVAPRLRSRTFTRRKTRTPGGRHVIHYARRKPGRAECAYCGDYLKAVPRGRPSELRGLPKSAKRPERPFGGVLCSKCMRAHFRKAAQAI